MLDKTIKLPIEPYAPHSIETELEVTIHYELEDESPVIRHVVGVVFNQEIDFSEMISSSWYNDLIHEKLAEVDE